MIEESGAIDSTVQTEGILSCNLSELHKEVDAGWRRFWKKRGFDSPPELYSDKEMWFGNGFSFNEKVTYKESQQKKAERATGIQKANRDFFER